MSKIKVVSEKEFYALFKEEEERAKENAKKAGLEGIRWYLSQDKYPCIYLGHPKFHRTLRCPITGESKLTRKLPASFQQWPKKAIIDLRHAADVPCINMNLNTWVRCYAVTTDTLSGYIYHVCTHKVGKCPHKEAL